MNHKQTMYLLDSMIRNMQKPKKHKRPLFEKYHKGSTGREITLFGYQFFLHYKDSFLSAKEYLRKTNDTTKFTRFVINKVR